MNKEIYTLEQLRKMNQLDGDKKLMFVEQIVKIIDRVFKRGTTNMPMNYHVDLLKEFNTFDTDSKNKGVDKNE